MKKNIRSTILDALLRAESGKLQKIEQKNMPAEDRSLFKEISLGVTRNKLFLDHVIDQFIKKNPTVRLRNILRMGTYELLFLDKIPHYATLFETVELTKSKPEKNFINAILRKISREPKERFLKREFKTLEDVAIQYSFPLWMVEKWDKLFGFEQVQEICKVSSTVSPLTFRINTIKKEALETEKQIKNLFSDTSDGMLHHSYHVPSNTNFSGKCEFKEGHFVVQNEASQLVVLALDPKPYETVLDACAHPGVKTSHTAAIMDNKGEICCLDKKKPTLFHDNMKRLGVATAQYHMHDLLKPLQLKKTFDRVLLDAPCSCWGILRKHPEIKWHQTEKNIVELQDIQKKIRDNLLPRLKKGGVFVYAVCTFSKEETLDFIEDTLQKYPNLKVETLEKILPQSVRKFIHPSGYFMCTPQKEGLDGFFICRFSS